MTNGKFPVNIPVTLVVIALAAGMLVFSFHRLSFTTDIVASLPHDVPVIDDARKIFKHHPLQDQIAIDIFSPVDDTALLTEAGRLAQTLLRQSGLFESVGTAKMERALPAVIDTIARNLPIMFTREELERELLPLTNTQYVGDKLELNIQRLLNLEGIGQAQLMAIDPLEWRNLVLAKLAYRAPVKSVRFVKGFLVSPDQHHLLIPATPITSATDTAFARKAMALMHEVETALNRSLPQQQPLRVSAVGAFRAALDNETLAKRDTRRAILFATAGIACLLFFTFPRPLLGLLALLPALFGVTAALFIYALVHDSVSLMTLGFGGAIISIAVDHGVAYMLFLDRPNLSTGKAAAHEVRAIGLIATLTTVGAFSILSFSGFPIMAQIGQFAALGIAGSFVFVHLVFPHIIPAMPAAKRDRTQRFAKLLDRFLHGGSKPKLVGAIALAAVLIFWAQPRFEIDLKAMNTISEETHAAEKAFSDTWGGIQNKILLMLSADNLAALRHRSDALSARLETDIDSGILSPGFLPAALLPGPARARSNLDAWKHFWNPERLQNLEEAFLVSAQQLGFAAGAFEPFFEHIQNPAFALPQFSADLYDLMNIVHDGEQSHWRQFYALNPGPNYDGRLFVESFNGADGIAVFDPALFSTAMGTYLSGTFMRMLLIIAVSAALLLLIFFFDVTLTIIALAPLLFAFICTIATQNLTGHSLGIPGLMLSIVLLGMGIDYSLFFVRSHQRYLDETDTALLLIRKAVFLAATSTIIGFFVLSLADHSLLKSAGFTSLLGISYAFIGTICIVPPLLRAIYSPDRKGPQSPHPLSRAHYVRQRYRHTPILTRLFVHLQLKHDPLYAYLSEAARGEHDIIDAACGYGIHSAWLQAHSESITITAITAVDEQRHVAQYALGPRTKVHRASPRQLPLHTSPAQMALLLDAVHTIAPEHLSATFERLRRSLQPRGRLLLSYAGNSNFPAGPLHRFLFRRATRQGTSLYRHRKSDIMKALDNAGFTVSPDPSPQAQPGRIWICATAEERNGQWL